MSYEQSLNRRLSAEHKFMNENWSYQTGAAKRGGVRIWIPMKINVKLRREVELADPSFFFEDCGWN